MTIGNPPRGEGGVLTYMGHIGMCRREGYGFQAVHSGKGSRIRFPDKEFELRYKRTERLKCLSKGYKNRIFHYTDQLGTV